MMASSGTDLVKIPTIDKAYLRAKYEGMSTPKIALYGTAPPFFGGLDISIDIAYSTVFYIYQPNIYIYMGFPYDREKLYSLFHQAYGFPTKLYSLPMNNHK